MLKDLSLEFIFLFVCFCITGYLAVLILETIKNIHKLDL